MDNKPDRRKYVSSECDRKSVNIEIMSLKEKFVVQTILRWDNKDVTPRQIENEFWEMVAEYYGFKIEWPKREGEP